MTGLVSARAAHPEILPSNLTASAYIRACILPWKTSPSIHCAIKQAPSLTSVQIRDQTWRPELRSRPLFSRPPGARRRRLPGPPTGLLASLALHSLSDSLATRAPYGRRKRTTLARPQGGRMRPVPCDPAAGCAGAAPAPMRSRRRPRPRAGLATPI